MIKHIRKILGIYIFSLVSFIFGGSTTKSEIKNIEVRGENITKYYGDWIWTRVKHYICYGWLTKNVLFHSANKEENTVNNHGDLYV